MEMSGEAGGGGHFTGSGGRAGHVFRKSVLRGTWVAQSVKRLTSAQVIISRGLSSSPVLGFVLIAWSWPGILSLSLPLSVPPSLMGAYAHALSLFPPPPKINKLKKRNLFWVDSQVVLKAVRNKSRREGRQG